MACEGWNERLVERLYGEIDPSDEIALDAHLAECRDCRETLERLESARRILSDCPPRVPAVPRVVVLGGASRPRRTLAFAAGFLAAALLAGGGWAAGRYFETPAPPSGNAIVESAPPPLDEDAIAARVLARIESRNAPEAVTPEVLEAAFDRYDRQVNRKRAADVEYLLGEIAASEHRVGTSIGRTNQALQYVALKSDPRVVQR